MPVGAIRWPTSACSARRGESGGGCPHYVLQLGGQVTEGRTRLAAGEEAVPARNVPALVVELLAAFSQSAQFPDFSEFLKAHDGKLDQALAAKHRSVPEFAEDQTPCIDWDSTGLFSLAGRGAGECGAGVFDLIEVDLANARDALQHGRLLEATVLAARALLVTQGQQARDEEDALELFTRIFLPGSCFRPRLWQSLAWHTRQSSRGGSALSRPGPRRCGSLLRPLRSCTRTWTPR